MHDTRILFLWLFGANAFALALALLGQALYPSVSVFSFLSLHLDIATLFFGLGSLILWAPFSEDFEDAFWWYSLSSLVALAVFLGYWYYSLVL